METSIEGLTSANRMTPAYPIHPGSVLGEELKSRGIRQKEFAARIGMQASHLSALIHGTRNFTADIASKVESALEGIPATFWMRLQSQYILDKNKLERRYSSHVDGYKNTPRPSAVLNDSGCERTRHFSLYVPETDANLLHLFADRMGWDINEIDE